MDPPRWALCRPDEEDGEACRRLGVFAKQRSQAGGLALLRKAKFRQKQEVNSAGQCVVFPAAEGNSPGIRRLPGCNLLGDTQLGKPAPPAGVLRSCSALVGTAALLGHCPCLELVVLSRDRSMLSSG